MYTDCWFGACAFGPSLCCVYVEFNTRAALHVLDDLGNMCGARKVLAVTPNHGMIIIPGGDNIVNGTAAAMKVTIAQDVKAGDRLLDESGSLRSITHVTTLLNGGMCARVCVCVGGSFLSCT